MYGWRAQVGLLVPSVNTCSEPQFGLMSPAGVAFYSTRLRLTGSSREEFLRMADEVEVAAGLLADLGPDLILFHCTGASVIGGVGYDQQLMARIERATGCPAGTTATGIVTALHALGARKVALVTPYPPDVNQVEAEFLAGHGFDVVTDVALGFENGRDYPRPSPQEWYRHVRDHLGNGEDAIFISCTNIRVVEIIQRLEDDFDRPVVTSNQGAFWYALRRLNIPDAIPGYGRLLTECRALPVQRPASTAGSAV